MSDPASTRGPRWAIPARTRDLQRRASDPASSAWVSAHAGSGKTFVLAQRVVRLLLEGAPPSKILCLTFTKAAAANMSLRVFDILSSWTRMDDQRLRAEIVAMGAPPERIGLARRLFARAVETPGGLKIQTIHAFCERLLHLFPFEANAPARFEVLSEETQKELLAMAREEVLAEAVAHPQSRLGAALVHIAALTTVTTFDKLLREALGARAALAEMGRRQSDEYERLLAQALGARVGEKLADIEADMIAGGIAPDRWPDLARRLEAGGANDKKAAQRVRDAIAAPAHRRLEAWLDVFFTEGSPRKNMATRALDDDPALRPMLEAERDRLAQREGERRAAAAFARSAALSALAGAVMARYVRLKQARGLLDFDDLVERTRILMERVESAWVHCKLDAGVDHILVDEAQDTSADQWAILEALTGEFFVGEGARAAARTLFVVGDEKQSIYSFQGAEPRAFAEQARAFSARARDGGRPFELVPLDLSFRTARGVLESVDALFMHADHAAGVVYSDSWLRHQALKADLPGLVELWSPIKGESAQTPQDWRMPLDRSEEGAPALVMARRVAAHVKALLDPVARQAVHERDGSLRPVRAGDVLVLVRKRGPFFDAVIRALKDAGVPVAGADRLQLSEHIAVQDLVAAGRVALLAEDDLTLACVLKSPLIGLTDDHLLAIAPRRKGSLMEALRASDDPDCMRAVERIEGWRRRAGDAPFRFYARLLGPEDGRRAFLSRLGPEAADAVDEFLKLALEAETLEAPSLVTFLHRMDGADLSIKRDMEAAGEAVRVMTVHASKGLEAKIVYLPDTCSAASGGHDAGALEIEGPGGAPLLAWRKGAQHDPPPLETALDAARRAEEEEHRRLFYVAMTRAEERLYIGGFHGSRGMGKGAWLNMAQMALEPTMEPAPAPWDASDSLLRRGEPARLPDDSPAPGPAPAAGLAAAPDWLTAPAPREAAPPAPLSPSSALAAVDQREAHAPDPAGARQESEALLVGSLTHALLQYLPEVAGERRMAAGLRFLAARAGARLTPERREALCARALAVLDDPELAPLFGPGSRAEIAIAADVELGGRARRVVGQIDRLLVTAGEIVIADFKTGAPRPLAEAPQAYLAQLGLYARAAARLWPGRAVRTLLVWTSGPQALEAPPELLEAALARLGTHDAREQAPLAPDAP
jgi:ATP-dependent helicase/nuclease subunit A